MMVNGFPIDIKIVPWTVLFKGFKFKEKRNGTTVELYGTCASTFISPEFVLLAAHCFDNVTEGNHFHLVHNSNKSDLRSNKKRKKVITSNRHDQNNVFIHPKYDPVSKGSESQFHDMALIKLSQPMARVQPICIHCAKVDKFRSGTAYVMGWGQETNDCVSLTRPAKMLNGRPVKIVGCKAFKDRKGNICVESNSVMQGDSGGALLANNGTHFVQVGILSTGLCDQKNKSLINFYVPINKKWLKEITGLECPT
ncbi:hypothetical protein niasHT_035357 [Heterodera trifolii]|uniref:Peptidase S1 domain-containing protein n=1 Tax=Heterodera trifolii TaxID=157864 RepID=A0ABD2I1V0_9BILA